MYYIFRNYISNVSWTILLYPISPNPGQYFKWTSYVTNLVNLFHYQKKCFERHALFIYLFIHLFIYLFSMTGQRKSCLRISCGRCFLVIVIPRLVTRDLHLKTSHGRRSARNEDEAVHSPDPEPKLIASRSTSRGIGARFTVGSLIDWNVWGLWRNF